MVRWQQQTGAGMYRKDKDRGERATVFQTEVFVTREDVKNGEEKKIHIYSDSQAG